MKAKLNVGTETKTFVITLIRTALSGSSLMKVAKGALPLLERLDLRLPDDLQELEASPKEKRCPSPSPHAR